MNFNLTSEQIIQKYSEDEQIMIRLYIHWCKSHQLDPVQLYSRAYPEQLENLALKELLNEADEEQQITVDNETMIEVLQMFGNDDLAFVLVEELNRLFPGK